MPTPNRLRSRGDILRLGANPPAIATINPLWLIARPLPTTMPTFAAPISSSEMCYKRKSLRLFDHLVGAGEQDRWQVDTNRFGGLDVDDERELGRLLDRQVGRLGALENLVHIGRGASMHFLIARP